MQTPSQFRDHLNNEFETRRRANPRYSLRAFSRDLGIASSLLSRLLKGKVPFTTKMLARLGPKVKLPPELHREFAQEIKACEERRKQDQIRRASVSQLAANRSSDAASVFIIPCHLSLVPDVLREIRSFQDSLMDFVNEKDEPQGPACELQISFRYSAKKA